MLLSDTVGEEVARFLFLDFPRQIPNFQHRTGKINHRSHFSDFYGVFDFEILRDARRRAHEIRAYAADHQAA